MSFTGSEKAVVAGVIGVITTGLVALSQYTIPNSNDAHIISVALVMMGAIVTALHVHQTPNTVIPAPAAIVATVAVPTASIATAPVAEMVAPVLLPLLEAALPATSAPAADALPEVPDLIGTDVDGQPAAT